MNKFVTINSGFMEFDDDVKALAFKKHGKATIVKDKICGVINEDGNTIILLDGNMSINTDKDGMIRVLKTINGN